MNLYEDERLDYLLAQDMKIIQSPSVFNFSLDAVLLADFAWVPIQKGNLLDLCTGNAVVPSIKYKNKRKYYWCGNSRTLI